MDLKPYQTATLDVLKRFLDEALISGPKAAFTAITTETEQRKRLGAYAGPYVPLNGLEETPYVCLRLPTGGGKTILASHAINVARKAVGWRDYPLVLWLTPSNIIRTQTAEALKNPRHPYRAAMDAAFGGRVRVFDIADFTTIRPQDLRDNLCVVVSTIQTLRVDKTEGRNVYKHQEELESHFTGVPRNAEGLEKLEDGSGVKFSFVNLLHMMRPLMIVDEAHNAVTQLSRDMQARVNPCAIIEFTATPAPRSNVLHSVSAQEVKAAGMIKLPIMLAEHPNWQDAVSGAIQSRARLAEAAEKDTRYIRPIVLFQAQPKDEEVTVEKLKQHLIDVEGIDEARIAIATGDQRGLDGIDLFDRSTKIDFIITQQALKEGWDCSFAYVFCSLVRLSSGKDVEQLLGRVLRMPYAEPRAKALDALNRAYAHVSETSFSVAANALRDRLIGMGFEEQEAEDAIEPVLPLPGGEDLFGRKPPPVMTVTVPASDAVQALHRKDGVRVVPRADGNVDIEISSAAFTKVQDEVKAALSDADRKGFQDKAAEFIRDVLSPAERGEPFGAAALGAIVEDQLTFDLEEIEEYFDWSLAAYPARLEPGEFSVAETANQFSLDLDGRTVVVKHVGEDPQGSFGFAEQEWTREKLALWLDGETRRIEVGQADNLAWISRLLNDLIERRGLPLAGLMRGKYALARKISEKLTQFRKQHRAEVYQAAFFKPEARVEVSFDHGFSFKAGMYDGVRMYPGRPYEFSKHFLGPRQVPAFDGTGTGEEFECAKALDSLPQVKFWLRLVKQHPNSFWLPTSSDKFYPDFIAQLHDGRTLVIEYKGADRIDNADTAEKSTIGALWERKSGGLFLVVGKSVDGMDPRRQMLTKIGG